jgi:exopolyphosphatase/guanosine-5'-triphosphate,3'-diphosphate pyrophosphatase
MPASSAERCSRAARRNNELAFMPSGEIRAVIDVGTNSVKLLVAEVESSSGNTIVRPIYEGSEQTRLGQGFYETHILQRAAIVQTAEAVAQFAVRASGWQPARTEVIATSAARDALNQMELIEAISSASGLPIRVISGEQEAAWAYQGVTSDARFSGQALLVMDVGGGSTEFILGMARQHVLGRSFPLGSVRLHERLNWSDPPSPEDLSRCEEAVRAVLRDDVGPALIPRLNEIGSSVRLVATGGTGTLLARIVGGFDTFERERIEGVSLDYERVNAEKLRLWNLPLEARKKVVGLLPNRADIILGGIIIFAEVMRFFGFDEVKASTRGMRFAALLDQN